MADSFERDLTVLAGKLSSMAEEIPQKAIAKATRAGAGTARRAIQSKAPIRTGRLQSGIVIHKEKATKSGVQWHDILMDAEKNSIFQKPIKNPDRSKSSIAYYPASMEYGYFRRRSGGGLEMVPAQQVTPKPAKVPGRYFMRSGADASDANAKETIVKTLSAEIDKLWR